MRGCDLERDVCEVCHLGWAGEVIKEIEDVVIVGWQAVAKVNCFHGGEKGMRGEMVVHG